MGSVLVQTLVVRRGQVLLGRWRSGAFAGRLTGLLGKAEAPAGGAPPSPELAAASICGQLLGSGVAVDPRRLRRRGLFTFEERDTSGGAAVELGAQYSEHQLVLRLAPEEADGGADKFEPVATETFEPVGWFGPNDLPYHLMPEDDEKWYEDVIYGDKRLRGTFAFEGTKLVDHSLHEVDPAEGLCGLTSSASTSTSTSATAGASGAPSPEPPLLLHNPACSKSRALREALEARGVRFAERRYLEDPLTLSELETLLARLRAASLPRAPDAGGSIPGIKADVLCRDQDLVRELRSETMLRGGFFGEGSEVGRQEDDLLLEAIAQRPELLQRPALVYGRRAALGRPSPEDALRLLA